MGSAQPGGGGLFPRLWGSALATDLGTSKSSDAISPQTVLSVSVLSASHSCTESTDGEPWVRASQPGAASRVSIWVELPEGAGRDLKCPFASLVLAAFSCAHVPAMAERAQSAEFALRRGTGNTGELSETPLVDEISIGLFSRFWKNPWRDERVCKEFSTFVSEK